MEQFSVHYYQVVKVKQFPVHYYQGTLPPGSKGEYYNRSIFSTLNPPAGNEVSLNLFVGLRVLNNRCCLITIKVIFQPE